MKSGLPSLNPHAASYVPLSKRVPEPDHNNVSRGGTARNTSTSSNAFSYPHANAAQGNFAPRSHPAHGYSQNPPAFSDNQMMEMQFEMDLAFLQMNFPGLSEESIADVYLANQGDLESSMDMLTHLELNTFDYPEKLPETLDIGDVPESGSSAESISSKMKNVSIDVNASSSTQ